MINVTLPEDSKSILELCYTVGDYGPSLPVKHAVAITTIGNEHLSHGMTSGRHLLNKASITNDVDMSEYHIPAEIEAIIKLTRSGRGKDAYRLYSTPSIMAPKAACILVAFGIKEVVIPADTEENDDFQASKNILDIAGINLIKLGVDIAA